MNGGEIIAEVLKGQGVNFLFTLCGGHISPLLVGAKKHGLRVIDVRQEPTAVFAADAVSRLTGIPRVAAVTAGPGVTNSITAVKNAQMAESPLILLGGATATVLKGRGALQDIEQIELYKTLTKWSASIEQDCDIVPILEEAFDVAKSGIPGPVFIECPIDILYDEDLVREWYNMKKESSKSASLSKRVINWYLKRHVDKLFACSDKPIKTSQEEGEEIIPFSIKNEDIEITASQINNFGKPILIIGSQAILRTEETPDLARSVKRLGLPVYLTGMARGLLGEKHPLQFHHGRSKALREADLVILAGMPMDFRLDYGRAINKKAYLIVINRDKGTFKNLRKADLGIQADASRFLQNLEQFKMHTNTFEGWFEKLNQWEMTGREKIEKFSTKQTDYINPLKLCKEVNKIIDDNSIIIGDGGDFVATASYIVEPRNYLSWLDPGPFGTLGIGAGFALGAKLVRPNAEVWLLYGDGAAGYSIIEFDTFKRHNIPIIAVIGNDAGWTQIARDQIEYLDDEVGTLLTYNNYDKLVEALGAKGILIQDEAEISDSLLLAKKIAKEGTPVLINALIGNTDFRKGSISM